MNFDPNAAAGSDSGIFGLPFTQDDSALVLVPVPWEVTTSYGGGTSKGPAAILEASKQVDLYDGDVLRPYEKGICLLPESAKIRAWNREGRREAAKIIRVGGEIGKSKPLAKSLKKVNELGGKLNQQVFQQCKALLDQDKIVGVLGGDHSVPFGAIQALATRHPSFGVLHFDAHMDLRDAYEGFTWSHASIMRNVLEEIPSVTKLVQVGVRDYCEEEVLFARSQGARVRAYSDRECANRKQDGETWAKIAAEIANQLPEKIWVSFDIDGLDPRYCPHTGTPVPGGLEFQEANRILSAVVRSGRTIVGFDLNEVSPGQDGKSEWDANVGARVLYKLCAWTLASQKRASLQT